MIPLSRNVMFEHGGNEMRTGGNISSIFSWKMSNAGEWLAASAARRSAEILVVAKKHCCCRYAFSRASWKAVKNRRLLTRAWSLGKKAKVSNYRSRDTKRCAINFSNPFLPLSRTEYLRLFGLRDVPADKRHFKSASRKVASEFEQYLAVSNERRSTIRRLVGYISRASCRGEFLWDRWMSAAIRRHTFLRVVLHSLWLEKFFRGRHGWILLYYRKPWSWISRSENFFFYSSRNLMALLKNGRRISQSFNTAF